MTYPPELRLNSAVEQLDAAIAHAQWARQCASHFEGDAALRACLSARDSIEGAIRQVEQVVPS